MKNNSVMVATPIHHLIHPRCRRSTEYIMHKSRELGTRVKYFELHGESLISRARQDMSKYFLENTDYEYILFWDSDLIWKPDNEHSSLIDSFIIHNEILDGDPVIGGLYVCKGYPHKPSVRTLDFQKYPDFRRQKETVVRVKYVSGGCMLVSRRNMELAYEVSDFPWQPFMCRNTDGELELLSEDWAFQERLQEKDVASYVDTHTTLLHMGWHGYSLSEYYGIIDEELKK